LGVERADVRQSQISLARHLVERGSYHLAVQLANRRRAFIDKRLGRRGWSHSESDERLIDEQDLLAGLVIECKAMLAEKSNAWAKAAAFWRRIEKHDRAMAAQSKAIDAIADPTARGYALLNAGEYEQAVATFESAAYTKGVVQVRALICERKKEWQQAADLWQSIQDSARYAAAMANLARSREDWLEAARWHQRAGQRTLAAQAARAARKTFRREQAALF